MFGIALRNDPVRMEDRLEFDQFSFARVEGARAQLDSTTLLPLK